jgi:hypothetical protein
MNPISAGVRIKGVGEKDGSLTAIETPAVLLLTVELKGFSVVSE